MIQLLLQLVFPVNYLETCICELTDTLCLEQDMRRRKIHKIEQSLKSMAVYLKYC